MGINQYANAAEKPLERPAAGNTKSFHQKRVQQVSSHRTSQEDGSELALEKLAKIVGNKNEDLFEVCAEAVLAGATIGEITRSVRINDTPSQAITPVCITRAAAQVEKLRERMDALATRTGNRPKAFLCNMGSLRDYKARSDFSRGFLAVGGYEVISPAGLKSPAEAAETFAKSGAKLAVICSTDDNYPALVPLLVEAIRARNPDAFLVLAGFPADQLEAHKKAGVNEFVHIRADAVALLSKFHTQHGIE